MSETTQRAGAMGKPLRVLLVVHQFFPHTRFGTERYTLELARGLRSQGHEATVLTMLPRDGTPAPPVSSYTWEGVPVLALDGSLAVPARFEDTFARDDLADLWREILWDLKPDVVHACHLLNHTPEFLALARESGVPLVLTLTDFWGICWGGVLMRGPDGRSCDGPAAGAYNCVAHWAETHSATTSPRINGLLSALRDTPFHDPMANAVRLLPGRIRRRLSPEIDAITRRGRHIRERYEHAEAWIAPSQHLIDRYVQAGYAPERFHRIPYGIAGPAGEEREALDTRFVQRRPEEAPLRFGYLGQIAPHKGVHQLVEAFRSADLKNATLSIHGGTDLFPDYVTRLGEVADGDPRIALRGAYPSDAIYRILAEIDVLVIPSLWQENAPLVLLSALASGTPVVLSAAQGMVEFVRPDKDALVYEIGDQEGLACCLSRLEEEPALLYRLVADQKPYDFSEVDCARATLEIYHQLGAGRRCPVFQPPGDGIQPTLRTLTGEEAPSPWDGGVLPFLAMAQARGLEVWVPRERDPAGDGATAASGLGRTARSWLRRLGSLHGGLRLAYHSRPCFSLWSFGRAGTIDVARHPGFAAAAQLEVVARHNRGSQSLLRYRVEGEDAEVSHEFRLTWPKGSWSRLVVPLVTKRGRRIVALDWAPTIADGRSPLKLDLLALRLG